MEFSSIADAERAIRQLNHTKLDGRDIFVRQVKNVRPPALFNFDLARITQTDPKTITNSRKNVLVDLIPETKCAPAPDLMAEMIEEDMTIVLGPLAEMKDITEEVIVVAEATVEDEIEVIVTEEAEVVAETDMTAIVVIIMAIEIMILEMIIDIETEIDIEKETENAKEIETNIETEITIEEEVIVVKEQEVADLEVGIEEVETSHLAKHNIEVFKL